MVYTNTMKHAPVLYGTGEWFTSESSRNALKGQTQVLLKASATIGAKATGYLVRLRRRHNGSARRTGTLEWFTLQGARVRRICTSRDCKPPSLDPKTFTRHCRDWWRRSKTQHDMRSVTHKYQGCFAQAQQRANVTKCPWHEQSTCSAMPKRQRSWRLALNGAPRQCRGPPAPCPLPIFEVPGQSMQTVCSYMIAWRSAGGSDCRCCGRVARRIHVNHCSDDALRRLRSSKLAQRQLTSWQAHQESLLSCRESECTICWRMARCQDGQLVHPVLNGGACWPEEESTKKRISQEPAPWRRRPSGSRRYWRRPAGAC